MKLPIFLVDAFTDVKFKGNPAGVCILDHDIDDGLMLKIDKVEPNSGIIEKLG